MDYRRNRVASIERKCDLMLTELRRMRRILAASEDGEITERMRAEAARMRRQSERDRQMLRSLLGEM